MKTTPDNEKLLDLIKDARDGKIVLPQFQRNFVWARDDITDLLVSILQGHFIGSFLLLEVDKENVPFAYRLLEGVTLKKEPNPELMILDGQQRMTSLHYVFAAPDIPLRWTKYPYRFFIDLGKVTEGDLEKAIQSERVINCAGMLDRQRQFESLIVPMTEMEHWDKWLNAYEQWLVKKDKEAYFEYYFPVCKPAWNTVIEQIRDFLVPTLSIPKIKHDSQEALAEVCAIFEKINSMGVKLSVYDLLTARLYKNHIDLHGLWLETVDNHHLLDEYSEGKPDEFGVYVLRTIALIRGLDVKSKALINLSPMDKEKGWDFEKDWRKAVTYMEKALERMTSIDQDGFGAFDRKWMPYITMISPLAAMLAAIDDQKLGHSAYKLMRRWYWSAVFRERYATSVESNIARDYQDFLKAVKDPSSGMNAVQEARVNILDNPAYSLQDVSRLNSVYRGVMCLVALRGAKDFRADDSIQFHALEDHHIFPDGYLKELKGPDAKPMFSADRIKCVLNRTLIADKTNNFIRKRNPSDYLVNVIPAGLADTILPTHYIGPNAMIAMQADDFDAFIAARENALTAEIRSRIGK